MSDIAISYKVTAIQGHDVSDAEPADGDTLVWSEADGYYKPQMSVNVSGLTTVTFLEDGYWTCPEGVTTVLVAGSSGGCGAQGGGGYMAMRNDPNYSYPAEQRSDGGQGASAGVYNSHPVNVVPGTVYPVTIGQGGLGTLGAPRESNSVQYYMGQNIPSSIYGGATYFGNLFKAKIATYNNAPYQFWVNSGENVIGFSSGGASPGQEESSIGSGYIKISEGYAIGGQAGSRGNGGDGAVAGQAGESAPANSGAGGGGGGGNNDDSGDGSGFAGGNGGSGYLHIIY